MTIFNYDFAINNGFFRREFLFRPKNLSNQEESILVEEYIKDLSKNTNYNLTHKFLSVAFFPFPEKVAWIISLKEKELDRGGCALFKKMGVVLNVEELFIELEGSIRKLTNNKVKLISKGIFL